LLIQEVRELSKSTTQPRCITKAVPGDPTAKWFHDNVYEYLQKALRVLIVDQPVNVNIINDFTAAEVDTTTQTAVTVTSTAFEPILSYTVPANKLFRLKIIELTMHEGAFCGVWVEKISSGTELKRVGMLSQAHPRDTFNFGAIGLDFQAGEILNIKGKVLEGNCNSKVYATYAGDLQDV